MLSMVFYYFIPMAELMLIINVLLDLFKESVWYKYHAFSIVLCETKVLLIIYESVTLYDWKQPEVLRFIQ